MTTGLISVEIIENKIHVIRGQKVMIDSDLAEMYGVQTKVLNQAVKRHLNRFPEEFMFQLNDEEWTTLRSQIVTFEKDIRKYKPYAFTEHGVAMLSSVLNSKQAIAINIQIIKTFVKIRQLALTNEQMAQELEDIKTSLISYAEHNNANVEEIFRQLDYLNDLHKPSQIGF